MVFGSGRGIPRVRTCHRVYFLSVAPHSEISECPIKGISIAELLRKWCSIVWAVLLFLAAAQLEVDYARPGAIPVRCPSLVPQSADHAGVVCRNVRRCKEKVAFHRSGHNLAVHTTRSASFAHVQPSCGYGVHRVPWRSFLQSSTERDLTAYFAHRA
jgi:hypothetical protein